MNAEDARRRFMEMVLREEEEPGLAEAALLIAVEEYPGLEPEPYLQRLRLMADEVGERLGTDRDPYHIISAINEYMFSDLGFIGNDEDYYDPRNSYLNEVMDRRTGLPVTISLVYMEIARHLGLALVGLGFPAHFLIKYVGPEAELILDPYHGGRFMSEEDCVEQLRQVYGNRLSFRPEFLEPTSSRAVLARLLKNLEGIYLRQRDYAHAYAAVERFLLIQPDAVDEIRERGLIAFRLGDVRQAIADLRRYLQLRPNGRDRDNIRNQLGLARRVWRMRN
jgi:regulator of sirC expression with transglutaminase-like and TPR domain